MTVLFDYLMLAFYLFFMSFFIDIFYRYLRYRELIPRKMFTYKEGGIFEHYILVGTIIAVVGILQVVTGLYPFELEDPNLLSLTVSIATNTAMMFIFIISISVFALFILSIVYAKITKPEDKQAFYRNISHRIMMMAFFIAASFTLVWLISEVVNLLN